MLRPWKKTLWNPLAENLKLCLLLDFIPVEYNHLLVMAFVIQGKKRLFLLNILSNTSKGYTVHKFYVTLIAIVCVLSKTVFNFNERLT